MKFKKLLGIALSAALAVSAVVPWTGLTASAEGPTEYDGDELPLELTIDEFGKEPYYFSHSIYQYGNPCTGYPYAQLENTTYSEPEHHYVMVKETSDTDEIAYVRCDYYNDWADDQNECKGHNYAYIVCDDDNSGKEEIIQEHDGKIYCDGECEEAVDFIDKDGNSFEVPETLVGKDEITTYTYGCEEHHGISWEGNKVYFHYTKDSSETTNEYTINFTVDPTNVATLEFSSDKVKEDEIITFPTYEITDTNYKFDGWYMSDGLPVLDPSNLRANGDATYTAKFSPKTVDPQAKEVDQVQIVITPALEKAIESNYYQGWFNKYYDDITEVHMDGKDGSHIKLFSSNWQTSEDGYWHVPKVAFVDGLTDQNYEEALKAEFDGITVIAYNWMGVYQEKYNFNLASGSGNPIGYIESITFEEDAPLYWGAGSSDGNGNVVVITLDYKGTTPTPDTRDITVKYVDRELKSIADDEIYSVDIEVSTETWADNFIKEDNFKEEIDNMTFSGEYSIDMATPDTVYLLYTEKSTEPTEVLDYTIHYGVQNIATDPATWYELDSIDGRIANASTPITVEIKSFTNFDFDKVVYNDEVIPAVSGEYKVAHDTLKKADIYVVYTVSVPQPDQYAYSIVTYLDNSYYDGTGVLTTTSDELDYTVPTLDGASLTAATFNGVDIMSIAEEGAQLHADNLLKDELNVIVFEFTSDEVPPQVKDWRYEIRYVSGDTRLDTVTGDAEDQESKIVNIPIKSFDGYSFSKVTDGNGEQLLPSGNDVYKAPLVAEDEVTVITVYYTQTPPVDPEEPDDKDDGDKQLPYIPPQPDTDDGEDLEEPDVPLVDPGDLNPGTSTTDEAVKIDGPVTSTGDGETIDEDGVPQVDAPKTGRRIASSLALLAGAAAVAVITFKKRNDK
ncbi:MAG: hypothetical protein ACOX6P_06770 [Candidatus Merdivicinus sp.]|jgi:uncharacterized repeat protein (TIGR02543 family)